ncbi:hypothetical protein WBG06_09020 [Nocardioides sp. CCNWLW239]|uniref:hypothetical protein n=1 Tax=Nocardioides sp. CCNWLW239 TaxID=3128902 RepID=UPI0030182CC1
MVHIWAVTPKGQWQLVRSARRASLWTRATLLRHVLIAIVCWSVLIVPWVLSDDSGTIGRLDRIGLAALGVMALLFSGMWLIAHRSVIAKQITATYPIGKVVVSEMDDRGFRIATALGEASWRWDQIGGAHGNAGILGFIDRQAVRLDRFLPGLMPRPSVWVPRALVADDLLVRLGLPVVGPTPVASRHGFPRGTAVTAARTWVVTADSQRRLARDAGMTLVLEPRMLAALILAAVMLGGQAYLTVVAALDGYGTDPTNLLVPVFVAVSIWALWRATRSQIRSLFPVGFSVSLQVEDVGIRLLTARDERVIPWRMLQGSRIRGSAFSYPNVLRPTARETIPAPLIPDDIVARLMTSPGRNRGFRRMRGSRHG